MIGSIIKRLKDDSYYRQTVFQRLAIYSGIISAVCCIFGILELLIANRYNVGFALMTMFLFFGAITILTPED